MYNFIINLNLRIYFVFEQPDRAAAVPKFGGWDDVNPQSAENYTEIFNKVREAKRQDSSNVSGTPSRPSYYTQKQEEQPRVCQSIPSYTTFL